MTTTAKQSETPADPTQQTTTTTTTTPPASGGTEPTLAELKQQLAEVQGKLAENEAHKKKLNEENAARRVDQRKTTEELERYKKGLAIIQGKAEPEVDPVLEAKKAADGKLRTAFLKAEVAAHAQDAHDVGLLFEGYKARFRDVEVNLDTEAVDTEAVTAVLTALRTEKPFLFRAKDAGKDAQTTTTTAPPKGGRLPPDNGKPAGGGNAYAQWLQIKEQGRADEALDFYKKNRSEILKTQP